jgi:hypothetical protein
MRREFVGSTRQTGPAAARANRVAEAPAGSPLAAGWWHTLQRAPGNRAVVDALAPVQRCGGEVHEGCACAGPDSRAVGEDVQRDVVHDTATQVQRDDTKDPADLTGTPFDALDATLKKKLTDRSVFAWTKPTLAASLDDMSNASLAVLARVGAMISANAPFLWAFVASLGRNGWITDNFGMRIGWTDASAVEAALVANKGFCKDNPLTAKYYHGTTSAYRQIPSTKGAASMHVVTAGSTEVHIDAHQPVEGKEESGLWAGQCDYDWKAWTGHASDVTGGGAGGARGTAVGRYGVAKGSINQARGSVHYDKQADEPTLADAERNLVAIETTVQKYAAMGAYVENEFEGDKLMRQDRPTMEKLERAEALIRQVDLAQSDRKPEMTPMQ